MYSKTTAMLMLLGFCSGASNLQIIDNAGTQENHATGIVLAKDGTSLSQTLSNYESIAAAVADDCRNDPCQNGGTCIDGDNTYTCECPVGYKGDDCEDVDYKLIGLISLGCSLGTYIVDILIQLAYRHCKNPQQNQQQEAQQNQQQEAQQNQQQEAKPEVNQEDTEPQVHQQNRLLLVVRFLIFLTGFVTLVVFIYCIGVDANKEMSLVNSLVLVFDFIGLLVSLIPIIYGGKLVIFVQSREA